MTPRCVQCWPQPHQSCGEDVVRLRLLTTTTHPVQAQLGGSRPTSKDSSMVSPQPLVNGGGVSSTQ